MEASPRLPFTAAKISDAVLETKLYIPQPNATWVSRARLTERLDEYVKNGLTLICAPAGFGKTSLLSQWIAQSPKQVAWLSLDAGDDEPVRFLSHLIASLQTLTPGVGESGRVALQSPQPPPAVSVMTLLINELTQQTERLSLVLDDLHLVKSKIVYDTLAFLLEHFPPSLHLILLSRSDPPLPLARLRARGQLTELCVNDLRFTTAEAATFLNDVMGLALAAEDVAVLEARTEGWIAGLQLAALSMQGRADLPGFIAAFSGSHRFIVDYLLEEVLERQSPEVRDFLLKTSILERFNRQLCNAITGFTNGQVMLEQLERANLFLVPLDDERHWYRYHHLFADVLRSKLDQQMPEECPELHHRAAEWFEANHFANDAIGHLLKTEDWRAALRLMGNHVDDSITKGAASTLISWFSAVPEAQLRTEPLLGLKYAGALAVNRQFDVAQHWLELAEQDLAGTNLWQGELYATKAFLAGMQGDATRAAEWSYGALERLPAEGNVMHFIALTSLVRAHAARGEPNAALAAIVQTRQTMRHRGIKTLDFRMDVNEGYQEVLAGRLRSAQAKLEQALHTLEPLALGKELYKYDTALAQICLGEIAYQHNALLEAQKYLEMGFSGLMRSTNVLEQVRAATMLAKVFMALGEVDNAHSVLAQVRGAAKNLHQPLALPLLDAACAAQGLALGQLEQAYRWRQTCGLNSADPVPFPREPLYLVLARVLIKQKEMTQALSLLEQIRQAAETAGRGTTLIEALVLEALAHDALGNTTQAASVLLRAVELGETEGYIRVFIDEGEPLAVLLRQFSGRTAFPAYVTKLLASFSPADVSESVAFEPVILPPGAEPLTERELTVLRLMSGGLSDKEIAKELSLSPNTIKWYARSIYSKLGVGKRAKAVALARELNLF